MSVRIFSSPDREQHRKRESQAEIPLHMHHLLLKRRRNVQDLVGLEKQVEQEFS